MPRSKRPLLAAALLPLSLATVLFVSPQAGAVDMMQFQAIATHPQANAQPTAAGKVLGELAFDGDKLIAGFGDYGANTGPIAINPYNITTGVFEGNQLNFETEKVMVIREINGKLYAPMADPRAAQTSTLTGFASNRTGSWQVVTGINSVHLFDITTVTGSDLWVVGSALLDGSTTDAGAVVYRSLDGGATWQKMLALDYNGLGGTGIGAYALERYYWAAALNGKLYVQANGVTPQQPLRVYDTATGSWSEESSAVLCDTVETNRVEVFDGKIYCKSSAYGKISVYDGVSSPYQMALPGGSAASIVDMYQTNDALFFLTSEQKVFRLDAGASQPVLVTRNAPVQASSVAVKDNYIYAGARNAEIYRSALPAAVSTDFSPEITTLSKTAFSQTDTPLVMTVSGIDFLPGMEVTIGGVQASVRAISDTSIEVTVDRQQLLDSGVAASQTTTTGGAVQRRYDMTATNPNARAQTKTAAMSVLYAAAAPTNPTNPGSGPLPFIPVLPLSPTNAAAKVPTATLAKTGENSLVLAVVASGLVCLAAVMIIVSIRSAPARARIFRA